jgi:hypothetical protein
MTEDMKTKAAVLCRVPGKLQQYKGAWARAFYTWHCAILPLQ